MAWEDGTAGAAGGARQEAEAVVREETSMKAVVLLQRRIRAWGARRQLL
jgi:hypothetical protein